MTLAQDSTHPTGVSDDSPRGGSDVSRARLRKARSALQLRRDAFTWDQIAESLGYPTARAAMVATELALEQELNNTEGHAFMRTLASDRYDRLLRSVWKKATDPENPEHLQALDRVRGLMRDHQELHGYQAPKQQTVTTPTQAQLEAWVTSVMKMREPELVEPNIFEAEVISDTGEPPSLTD